MNSESAMHVGNEGIRLRKRNPRFPQRRQLKLSYYSNDGDDGDEGKLGRGDSFEAVLLKTGPSLSPPQPSSPSWLSSMPWLPPSIPSHASWNIDVHEDDQTPSIYRVRKSLREVDQTAYTPKMVSLGPYHHHHAVDMYRLKPRALKMALTRAGKVNDDLRSLEDRARSLEDSARDSYEATLDIESNVVVHDAIFTLELFRGFAGEGFEKLGYNPRDVSAFRRGIYSLQIDMLMLENQLPLFVLESILDLQLELEPNQELDRILASRLGPQPSQSGRVASLALLFFENFRLTDENSAAHFGSDAGSSKARHCLDVFRRSLIGPETDSAPSNPPVPVIQPLQPIHCVTELYVAGIEIRHRETNRFWDIKFEDGVLLIPRLLIQPCTKSLFHNLIAFEERNLECSTRITAYVFFMADLIKSEMDVGHLRQRKIIQYRGKDGEVANLFNQLRQLEVVVDLNESYTSELRKQVNDYYNKISPHKKINYYKLLQQYFSSPCTIISFIVGVIMLLLAAGQTIYTVYDYYNPKK